MKTKPTKPRLTKQINNCWGEKISVPAFDTDDQIHAAMDDYADKLSEFYCGDELEKEIWFDFDDGSSDSTVVERNKKTFTYKTYYDGEEWEKEYCVASWYESLYEIKSTSLRAIAKKLAKFLDCESDIKEIRYNNV